MREYILKRKLVALAKTIACKRKGRDLEFNLYFEYISPSKTIGRCFHCHDTKTGRSAGNDIIISSIWIRRFPLDINGFKAIFLHEIAHTNPHIIGHGLDFRRECRKLRVMDYWNRGEKNF